MTAVTRRVLEMCVRVLNWLAAHPDDEPGIAVLVAQLRTLVARMTQVVDEQRAGRIDSRAASLRKQELRREMLAGPIAHLARIGSLAARETHELRSLVRVQADGRHAAGLPGGGAGHVTAAQEHKEVLVKHGLSESVLVQFGKSLDEFDAAVTLGAEGRTVHTAATRELNALTKEAQAIVRAMDARNRLRFQDDRQALELWVSARTVLGSPRAAKDAETPEAKAGGERDAGWDAGGGRRREARGMTRGRVTRELGR